VNWIGGRGKEMPSVGSVVGGVGGLRLNQPRDHHAEIQLKVRQWRDTWSMF
jgi:hypothetical protein